jgi:hypothetical protein
MPLVLKDRVKETTTTTGTGAYTLAGAVAGFQSFSVIGNGNATYYAATNGTDWEVGIGTYTASGTTLSRTTILESSNSGNAVNWGVGSKDIFCTYPSEKSSVTFPQGTITTNYTAAINEGVLTNTTSGAFTVTLPASPITGAVVVVADASGTWGTNNLTVGRNGATIAGLAEDLVCNINSTSVQLIYDGSTWRVYAQVGANSANIVTTNGVQTLTNKTISGASNTLTNISLTTAVTGTLPVANGGTGITSFGTGIATWLGTPSSANLAAAVTDETGSGALVFAGSPTFTGTVTTAAISMADNLLTRPVLLDYAVEGSAIGNTGGTRTLDLTVANFFSATLNQACTFTFSNPPASGDFGTFVLELTNGGAFAITWPASVDWPGGSAPTLTTSGKDQLVFTTRDGGTTWFGFTAGKDIK